MDFSFLSQKKKKQGGGSVNILWKKKKKKIKNGFFKTLPSPCPKNQNGTKTTLFSKKVC